ncbi:MAG: class I SAM-dependent methyltransferase [Candidatus Aenigmatarchaeota archaeon]
MKTTDDEYFSYLAKRSRLSFVLRKFMYRSIVKEFRGKTLDVGCGLGEILEMYKNVYGIDSNPMVVDYCKSRKLKCFLGNASKIPFKAGTFRTVFASHLIEHLKRPVDAIREFRRILKKKGLLIIIVPNRKGYERDKTHVKYWDKERLTNLLEDSGFKVTEVSYFPLSPKFLRDRITINEMRLRAIKL